MVRFLGREMGITGELYIRFQEFEPAAEPAAAVEAEEAAEPAAAVEAVEAGETAEEPDEAVEAAETADEAEEPAAEAVEAAAAVEAAEARTVPAVWVFEELILEEARERAAEEDAQRFDFPPYERFF
jgi:hypothetical protein